MNFIIIIKSTEISSLHWWREVNKITAVSFLKAKSGISMRSSTWITPTLLTFQSKTIDNPERLVNIFNNYFSTIGKENQAKIKNSYKNYTDYLTNENPNSFFLSPT